MAQVKERSPAKTKASPQHQALGISDGDMLAFYAKMVLVRTLDERLLALNRQGKVPIAASAQGVEASSMASAWAALMDGQYFFFPYYRDLPLKVMAGVTPLEIIAGAFGKAGSSFSGGRQFPHQGASLEHHIIQISNVVASGLTQATGYALGCKTLGEETVTLAYFGDGGSSAGECHEAMNFAGVHKLPIIFLCHNNKLAISVPQRKQMPIENLADRAAGYNFPGYVVDGTNTLEVYQRTQEAIKRARSKSGGPTLLEFKVERLKPHTTDDDDRRYRSPEELEQASKGDPLPPLRSYLIDAGLLTDDMEERVQAEARREINEATEAAEKAPWPDTATLFDHIYAS